MKRSICKEITIARDGPVFEDKGALPYWFADEPITVVQDDPNHPFARVTMTIYAEKVTVTPEMTVDSDGEVSYIEWVPPPAQDAAETLRADMLQRELTRAHASLARVLQLADAWDDTFGLDRVRTELVTETLRRTVREPPAA